MLSANPAPMNAAIIPITFSQRSFVVADTIWEYRASGSPIVPSTAPKKCVSGIHPRTRAASPTVTDARASTSCIRCGCDSACARAADGREPVASCGMDSSSSADGPRAWGAR